MQRPRKCELCHEREAVYANRRRIRGVRGKRLLRQRGELLERPFAHCYETGGMRRTHLRGHENILKRLLIHAGTCNLGLLMRRLIGVGTPRGFADRAAELRAALIAAIDHLKRLLAAWIAPRRPTIVRTKRQPGRLLARFKIQRAA